MFPVAQSASAFFLAGADANYFFKIENEDFTVSDLAGSGDSEMASSTLAAMSDLTATSSFSFGRK